MNKDWWKSKTVLVAGVGFLLAVLDSFGVPIPPEVYAMLGSIGLYGVRDAL